MAQFRAAQGMKEHSWQVPHDRPFTLDCPMFFPGVGLQTLAKRRKNRIQKKKRKKVANKIKKKEKENISEKIGDGRLVVLEHREEISPNDQVSFLTCGYFMQVLDYLHCCIVLGNLVRNSEYVDESGEIVLTTLGSRITFMCLPMTHVDVEIVLESVSIERSLRKSFGIVRVLV
ncbi:hypothetical protein VNO77_26034 [Canavalia gladiata]|uniref:Uncharacterized protein n=1 Tax=Canavalia gladiata TaxID=3824 RepID=A0AAN9KRN7_CANGL